MMGREVPASLIEPAGSRIDEPGGIEFRKQLGVLNRVELAPTFIKEGLDSQASDVIKAIDVTA